jgi:hypothetical protein
MQPSLQFSVQDFVSVSDSTASGSDTARVIHRNVVPPVEYRIAVNGKFEKIDALTMR